MFICIQRELKVNNTVIVITGQCLVSYQFHKLLQLYNVEAIPENSRYKHGHSEKW